jgi:pyridinium-3,5-biscarboxylic acid mononucleotide synthase
LLILHLGMRPEEVKILLAGVQDGTVAVEDAVAALQQPPLEDLGFARLDTHRELRQGLPEVIYAESKTPAQVLAIAGRLLAATTSAVLATRVPPDTAAALLEAHPDAVHHAGSRVVVLRRAKPPGGALGTIAILAAGTSDIPVAEEASVTAEAQGAIVEQVIDVGVAGVHRVLAVEPLLRRADVVIVVAGMEGALASLVGGITPAPVVAVPTSVGYGSSFQGLAALLGMLNSCAAGVTVTNIDNGFGAAMAALRLLRRKSV